MAYLNLGLHEGAIIKQKSITVINKVFTSKLSQIKRCAFLIITQPELRR